MAGQVLYFQSHTTGRFDCYLHGRVLLAASSPSLTSQPLGAMRAFPPGQGRAGVSGAHVLAPAANSLPGLTIASVWPSTASLPPAVWVSSGLSTTAGTGWRGRVGSPPQGSLPAPNSYRRAVLTCGDGVYVLPLEQAHQLRLVLVRVGDEAQL